MTEQSEHRYTGGPRNAEAESMGGCMLRLAWLVAAPIALIGLAASLAKTGAGHISLQSAAYWGVVVVALVARYLDIFRFHGQTAAGEPASGHDWRRFALGLVALAVVAWAAALTVGAA